MKVQAFLRVALIGSLCLVLQGRARACELLGVSFDRAVPIGQLFLALRCHGANNPDGWGLASYPDKSAVLFKEPANAATSKLAEFLASQPILTSSLLIAHIRKASVGGPSYENTHPFVRELDGKEYALAHNGTLKNYRDKLALSRLKPLGQNDCEFLLCYLLGRIEQQGIAQWQPESFAWLRRELQTVNDTGLLNCIFTDGTYLFSYHDKSGFNSLHYLRRHAPYGTVSFPDLHEKIDLSAVYPESAVGVVVATKPLTDEAWVRFAPGQLLVFRNGVQVFPKDDKGDVTDREVSRRTWGSKLVPR
jgi:predicted glutamine amidotransferase